jgi:tetratricopeptide (TPR) repeat protein
MMQEQGIKQLPVLVITLLALNAPLLASAHDDPRALRFQQFQKEGIRLLTARNYQGALENFNAALAEHSTSWQTWQNIALCHNRMGDYEEAVLCLQKSIEIGGLHVSQCTIMAGAEEGLGEPKKALHWLELACSVEPSQAADPVMQARLNMLRNPMHSPPGSPNAPDYVSSLDKIYKWRLKDFPIKVFVRKNIQMPDFYREFMEIATDSLDQWCKASGNVISYKFVNDRESANLICDYTDRRTLVASDREPGLDGAAEDRFRDDASMGFANITILIKDAPGPTPFRSREELTKLFLHEAGHALGMHGHSPNRHDVIFYCSTPEPVTQLSQRDKNTISKLYHQ